LRKFVDHNQKIESQLKKLERAKKIDKLNKMDKADMKIEVMEQKRLHSA